MSNELGKDTNCNQLGRCIIKGLTAEQITQRSYLLRLYNNCTIAQNLFASQESPGKEKSDFTKAGGLVSWIQYQNQIGIKHVDTNLSIYAGRSLPNDTDLQPLLIHALKIRNLFEMNPTDEIIERELVCRLHAWVSHEGYTTRKVRPTSCGYTKFLGAYLDTVLSWNPEEYAGEKGQEIMNLTFLGVWIMFSDYLRVDPICDKDV